MNDKKRIRRAFREGVLTRDGNKCRVCGWKEDIEKLDPHHITDRSLMPNGGYCKENGITLCPECHLKAENFHSTGAALPGWHPDDMYKMIRSSYEDAVKKSEKIK